MKTIDSIWAAVTFDSAEQIEGVCATKVGADWFPLIAADEDRLVFVREQARAIAEATGQTVRLIRMTHRENLETFRGKVQ